MRSARDVVQFSSDRDVRAIATGWAHEHGFRMLRMSSAALVFGKRPVAVALPVMVELASRDTLHTVSCWGRLNRIVMTRDISLTDPARTGRRHRLRAQGEINELLWELGAPPLEGTHHL
ncbi:hypothetical protein OO014_10760 [Intrasporangium calvum]|uniref:Uncharacterized protein n=1 Tax=Intrasporangium calvum TaxID=53358 RepID=A0ABT5GHX9_9MICO|nr:hypothetical protein [Intrasporangium calvum]MDC5697742.1 hypothetical protein [Intrasporangium calvum]